MFNPVKRNRFTEILNTGRKVKIYSFSFSTIRNSEPGHVLYSRNIHFAAVYVQVFPTLNDETHPDQGCY